MPHRLHFPGLSGALEFMALALTAIVAQINALLDETSWDRLTGRHGALFFMAIALLVFWNSNRLESKRRLEHLAKLEAKEDARRKEEETARQVENEAREQRHREAMALQQENARQLMQLTVEGIKAQGLVAESLKALKKTLDRRPCGLADIAKNPAINFDTETEP